MRTSSEKLYNQDPKPFLALHCRPHEKFGYRHGAYLDVYIVDVCAKPFATLLCIVQFLEPSCLADVAIHGCSGGLSTLIGCFPSRAQMCWKRLARQRSNLAPDSWPQRRMIHPHKTSPFKGASMLEGCWKSLAWQRSNLAPDSWPQRRMIYPHKTSPFKGASVLEEPRLAAL